MISAQDDLFGHQLPTTFDHVATSDPAWTERYWYSGHRVPEGDVVLDIGMGYYPNGNVMDGFAGVSWEGRQYNFRASRRLRDDPLETAVGPLRIEVIEGLRRHRLSLEDNDSALSFDIQFDATTEPHEEEPHFKRRNGRVIEDMIRTGQFGRYSGWLAVNGTRFDLTKDRWFAQRDHSWGIRAQMRSDETSPPLTKYPPFFYCWAQFQFEDRGLHLYAQQKKPGEMMYLSGEIVDLIGRKTAKAKVAQFSQRIEWKDDPLGMTLDRGVFTLVMEDGSEKAVEIRGLPARYFLKGGLYGGLNGWFHGAFRGKLFQEHDVWDLADTATRTRARTLSDHVMEVRMDGLTGYGIMEYGVGEGYPDYAAVQKFPAV